jgi:hypothetical protein
MDNVKNETWKDYDIGIQTIPVQQFVTRQSVPDAYVAIVRIAARGETLADWHLPRYAEPWKSQPEAQRDALDYAVKLIESGVFATPGDGPALKNAA